MKILSSEQIYQADQATITNEPISSIDLMERASFQCFQWLIKEFPDSSIVVHVCCGMGNNGGDGLAIARLLIDAGYTVHTYLICFSEKRSDDFKKNLSRLKLLETNIKEVRSKEDFPRIDQNELVIDAIFGIGLKRSPNGVSKGFIQYLNDSNAQIVSIDMPSGLFSDAKTTDSKAVVQSDFTISFQVPKLAFLLSENTIFLENWTILNIGLDTRFLKEVEAVHEFIDHKFVKKIIKKRQKFSHKGTYGHSLLIGGSFGKIGAIILSSKAALRAGSGLVSTYIPKCGYVPMQSSNPEVMVEVDDEQYVQFFNISTKANAIGIGPGLGTHLKTKKGFVNFVSNCKTPLVIDADGLNIISEFDELFEIVPEGTILTPHPKEFKRLVGDWKNDFEKLEKQIELSTKLNAVIVLKGAYSSIAFRGKIYFNGSGNPGLATAGSGDILTGIITSFLAQGYGPLEAAILGVFIHGRSADIAVDSNQSVESLIASDCLDHLGEAFKELK